MDKAWKFLALAACLGTLCAARPSTKHVGRPHQDSTKADYAKRMKAAAAPVVVPSAAKNAEVDPVSDSTKAAAALAAAVRRANDSTVAAQAAQAAQAVQAAQKGAR